MNVPKFIFIVPYRDRETQLICYINHMNYILEDLGECNYEILICHQKDKRLFNRGAMRNLGFIYSKEKYPQHYKDINFIFQDIDTMPTRKSQFNYETREGVIKHYYGFTSTLGGIISIKGIDYEFLNGYPNFWEWGYEDNCLQKRALFKNIKIDRSELLEIFDKNIVQLTQGIPTTKRNVRKDSREDYINDNGSNGINKIENINYIINNDFELINRFNNCFFIDFEKWSIPESDKVVIVEYTKNYARGRNNNFLNINKPKK